MADGIAIAPTEREALDAYSQIVSTVAERVLPSVASLRVRRSGSSRDSGAGSGVVVALYLLAAVVLLHHASDPRPDGGRGRRQ